MYHAFILLPSWALLLYFFYRKNKFQLRSSIVSASLIWGILLTAITEALSCISQINQAWLLASWGSVSILLILLLFLQQGTLPKQPHLQSLARAFVKFLRVYPFLSFSLLSFSLILVLTGVLASVAPPNTPDAMSYHMSRVMHWLQNQSVDHYPSHVLRQIDSPPWASFAILHLQALSGGDRLANLVQWASMVGSLVVVSLIAQQLGANLVGQLLSCAIAISIPIGLLQSATAQNDYVVSFWLACVAYNTLLISRGHITKRSCFEFGTSLGLALLTKATAYIYAFPFCILVIIHLVKALRINFWKAAFLSFLPAFLLNISHWWRNFQVFQTPLGLSGQVTQNHLFTPEALLSNIIRNIALHLPIPFQPFNDFLVSAIGLLHTKILGIDINDSRTTLLDMSFTLPVRQFQDAPIFLYESVSGNLLHLILILISIGLYIRYPKVRNNQRTSYLIVLLATIFIFNLLLVWQPWATRLHLPFFILISAFVGSVFSNLWDRFLVHYLLVFGLTLNSLPYCLFSSTRPLLQNPYFHLEIPSIFSVDRIEQYFASYPNLGTLHTQAIDKIVDRRCYDVGLYASEWSYEYLVWVVAKQRSPKTPITFRAINVDNPTHVLATDQHSPPCAILALRKPKLESEIQIQNPSATEATFYKRIMKNKQIQVYVSRR